MQLEDLKVEYDKLQIKYGAKELTSIYNGGCTNNPDICFVFMNPTGRNIASDPNWRPCLSSSKRSALKASLPTSQVWITFYKLSKSYLQMYPTFWILLNCRDNQVDNKQ